MYTCHAKPRRRTTNQFFCLAILSLHTDLYHLVIATICWMCHILRGSLWFWKTQSVGESVCWNVEKHGFEARFVALCRNMNFLYSYYRRSLSTSSMFWRQVAALQVAVSLQSQVFCVASEHHNQRWGAMSKIGKKHASSCDIRQWWWSDESWWTLKIYPFGPFAGETGEME